MIVARRPSHLDAAEAGVRDGDGAADVLGVRWVAEPAERAALGGGALVPLQEQAHTTNEATANDAT